MSQVQELNELNKQELEIQMHAVITDQTNRAIFYYMVTNGYKYLRSPHILYLYGKGNNGKTTLINAVKKCNETSRIDPKIFNNRIDPNTCNVIQDHKIYIIQDYIGRFYEIYNWIQKILNSNSKSLFIVETNDPMSASVPGFTNIICETRFDLSTKFKKS